MRANRHLFKPFALSDYSLLPQAGEGLGMRVCEYKINMSKFAIPHPNPSPARGRGAYEPGA